MRLATLLPGFDNSPALQFITEAVSTSLLYLCVSIVTDDRFVRARTFWKYF